MYSRSANAVNFEFRTNVPSHACARIADDFASASAMSMLFFFCGGIPKQVVEPWFLLGRLIISTWYGFVC
jgi:hypothetical protein